MEEEEVKTTFQEEVGITLFNVCQVKSRFSQIISALPGSPPLWAWSFSHENFVLVHRRHFALTGIGHAFPLLTQ